MLERGHDILYICYDNEAYMNTGVQRSSLTPFAAHTTTSPAAAWVRQPDAQEGPGCDRGGASRALCCHSVDWLLPGPGKEGQEGHEDHRAEVHADPCAVPARVGLPSEQTVKVAKLAVNCGLFPLFEMENGAITGVRKISKKAPVTEYLQGQARFRHLFQPGREKELEEIQAIADANIQQYGLM